jgi:hypothetical protein
MKAGERKRGRRMRRKRLSRIIEDGHDYLFDSTVVPLELDPQSLQTISPPPHSDKFSVDLCTLFSLGKP